KKNTMLIILVFFLLFNTLLAIYSLQINNIYALKGQIGLVFLALVLYFLRFKLNISRLTFFILLSGFSLHASHVLGNYYNHSPIIIPWDYVTHIVPFIGFSMLLFNFQKEKMDHKKVFCFRNFSLFITLFLAVSGIGVLIEVGEYVGYAILGMNDGALLFGGGDFDTIVVTSDVVSEIDKRDGGWYDTMGDLLFNSYTAILTLLILFTNHLYRYKKQKRRH
ncbi:MAG: hypothetical protein AABX05_00975, partial [Nanoarchaeota archaeon]